MMRGSITIAVDYTHDDVTLTVRDDGCGFDPTNVVGPHEGHFGLTGQRERTQGTGVEVQDALSSQCCHDAEKGDQGM